MGKDLKYLNGLCVVIHKNKAPTNGTSSLFEIATYFQSRLNPIHAVFN